jgi:hypothetical protein
MFVSVKGCSGEGPHPNPSPSPRERGFYSRSVRSDAWRAFLVGGGREIRRSGCGVGRQVGFGEDRLGHEVSEAVVFHEVLEELRVIRHDGRDRLAQRRIEIRNFQSCSKEPLMRLGSGRGSSVLLRIW